MANINNHHDKFTKQVLSDKKTAKEFFQLSFPKSILAQVDLDTIEQVKESYVDNELGQGAMAFGYQSYPTMSSIKYPAIKGPMRDSLIFSIRPDSLLYFRYFYNYI